jgi:acyl-CoA synthetase (AMP-forming)/AMP-acid ligase II
MPAPFDRVADIIPGNAERFPDRLAIRFEDRSFTFLEHAERCWRLADALRALGARHGDRIAIYARNCVEYLEVYGACEQGGFIAATVNFRLAAPEIEYVLGNLEPIALVFEDCHAATVAALRPKLRGIEHYIRIGGAMSDLPATVIDYEALLASGRPRPPATRPGPEDTVYIVHTSGTTGRPKGAMIGQRAQLGIARSINREPGLGIEDTGLIALPLFHLGAKFLQLAHHFGGAGIQLHRAFDTTATWQALERDGVTTVLLAPTMIEMLLEARPPGGADCPALHTIFYATAPIRESLLRRALAAFGPVCLQQYGSTEAGLVTTLRREQHVTEGPERERRRLASAGRPVRGVELRIVGRDGRPCPQGEAGEIEVRHPDLMQGYWRDPAATAEAFHDGWLRIGDIGRLDEDGFLYIVDRRKDMIISGGENIYPREVEAALLEHPAVADAAVIGIPDDTWGESVCAMVVLAPGRSVSGPALIEHCRGRIASYKKPKRIEFLEALPRLGTGKVDKVTLREPFWRGRARQVV